MALIANYLIDTSAAARMTLTVIREQLTPLINAGVVATCATLDAEALCSARSPAEYDRIRADRRDAYEYLPTEDRHWQQAFGLQRELATTRRHRAVGIADLLTAVLAAEHAVTLIHYDSDFDVVGKHLRLNHRWVAHRGSL